MITSAVTRLGGTMLSIVSEMKRVLIHLLMFGPAHATVVPYRADGETAPREYCLMRLCEARR